MEKQFHIKLLNKKAWKKNFFFQKFPKPSKKPSWVFFHKNHHGVRFFSVVYYILYYIYSWYIGQKKQVGYDNCAPPSPPPIFLVLKKIFTGVGDFFILSGESPYRGTGQNKLRRWGFNFKKLNCIYTYSFTVSI